jgi:hypothetical protein
MARTKKGAEADETKAPDAEKNKRKNPKKDPRIQAAIDKRRDMVASLMARGMRQIEIVNQLGLPTIVRNGTEIPNPSYLVNPESGLPFDKSQINRDVQFLRKKWRENAEEETEELLSQQLAELREARRVAWARGEMDEVRLNMVAEIKLTGTAKPEKKEVKLDDTQFKAIQSAEERVREKLARMAGQALTESIEDAPDTD